MIIRTFIILVFLSHFNVAVGQQVPKATQGGSIRIKVLSGGTSTPVPSALVYLSKTTTGGLTDVNGEVEIANAPFGTYDLAISDMNHEHYSRSIIIKSGQQEDLTIRMLPKIIKEATARPNRDNKWDRQYAMFQRLFFGPDHVKDCMITNPWILEFRISHGYFVAIANDPLKIENNFLGYDMEFQIKTCAFRADKSVITGDVLYKEKDGNDSLKAAWKENREYVYLGSQQHFFHSLIDNTLAKNDFEVWSDVSGTPGIVRYPDFNSNVGPSLVNISLSKEITPNSDGSHLIKMPSRLEIHYKGKPAKATVYRHIPFPVSWMQTKNDTLVVGDNGFVRNQKDLTVLGTMSDTRVTEWLPSDYERTGTKKPVDIIPFIVDTKAAMLEKPYVQTDRSYYYSGETMWLKGYMSYSMPLSRDTLSQSVYVELADTANHVVVTKRYPIEDGEFDGDIILDQSLPTGIYQLRSYTSWMLNFDPRSIFTKTIHVLSEKQAVRVLPNYSPKHDTLSNISLKTDKDAYAAREKITLMVDVFDSLDFRTISDLSIAVTDIDQAVPLGNEKTILKNYSFGRTGNTNPKKVKYDIEHGIDFSGQLWMGKKPVQGIITVFQHHSTENFVAATDDSGRFNRSLIFNDTLKLYLKAVSSNNKNGGVVKMSDNKKICPKLEFEDLMLDIYPTEGDRKPFKFDDVKVLDEVTVKAPKLEKSQPGVLHGQSDYTINGDWFQEHKFTDIILAIVAKVPGLSYNYDRYNPQLHFNGSMNLRRFIPPLILIDNIATDAASLSTLPFNSIDRVDVIKYSGVSIYGTRGVGGVIAVYTKRGRIEEPPNGFDKSKFQEVTLAGYSSTSAFEGPDYSTSEKDDRLDYRATIYWSPSLATDGKTPATVSFYAADVATKYRIVVEGVTIAGTPIRAEKVIEVVKAR